MTRLAPLLAVAIAATACGARPSRTERLATRPPAVSELEAAAKEAYARALDGDGEAARSAAARALDGWTRARGEAARRGAEDALLTEIDAAVIALGNLARSGADRIAVAHAANRITGSLDELLATYDPDALSASVVEIDYLGRELALDAMASDLRRANIHQSMLDDEWLVLRPALEASAEVDTLDAAVIASRAAVDARDPERLAASASALAEGVAAVERDLGK